MEENLSKNAAQKGGNIYEKLSPVATVQKTPHKSAFLLSILHIYTIFNHVLNVIKIFRYIAFCHMLSRTIHLSGT